jgi:hypothetical protein
MVSSKLPNISVHNREGGYGRKHNFFAGTVTHKSDLEFTMELSMRYINKTNRLHDRTKARPMVRLHSHNGEVSRVVSWHR